MRLHIVSAFIFTLICTTSVWAETTETLSVAASAPALPAESKVSAQADNTKVREVLDSLASQAKVTLLVESSVKGTLKLSLNDVSLESALTALCDSAKLQWRKIYISPKSPLLEQPDRFAAIVRLMSGLSFPDMVLAGSSMNKVGVHFEDKQAVKSAEDAAVSTLSMKAVYLVTNDSAVAAKTKKESEKSTVDEYTDLAKKQLEKFMEMTPEEREQAIMAGINMMDQIDPSYMAVATKAMMNADPDTWQRIQRRGSQMIFDMSTEDRRQFLKMTMRNREGMFTPEQMQILQEDTQAVIEELKESGEMP